MPWEAITEDIGAKIAKMQEIARRMVKSVPEIKMVAQRNTKQNLMASRERRFHFSQ